MPTETQFKQTDIGLIPEDWEVTNLSEIIEPNRNIRYGIVQPGKYEPSGCLMLRSQDYSKGWSNSDGMHRVNSTLENQYKNARLNKDDLIMTVVGAGIGQVVIAPDWLDKAIASRSTARIAIDKTKAAKEYVLCCLTSPLGVRQVLDVQKEGAQPVISCLDLEKFSIPYPTISEQEAIAEVLSDTDALIGALEKRIAKKRLIKQGAMQTLLTPKDDWEVKKLGEVAEIKKGSALSKNKLTDTGIYPCILYGELFTTYKEVINEVVSKTNSEEGIKSKSGDILFPGSTTTTGIDLAKASALLFNNILLGGDIIIVRNIIGYNSEFVSYFLNQISKNEIAKKTKGITIHHLYGNDLRDIEIALPLIQEQTRIATILSDMDNEINALEKKLSKTKELKQGLMQQLLTGKIRLV